jgi:hypothetical protein
VDPEPGIHYSRDGEKRGVKAEVARLYLVKGELYDVDSPKGRDGFIAKKGPKTVRIKTWVEDKETKEKVSFDEKHIDREDYRSGF